jgi:hypothetical protein
LRSVQIVTLSSQGSRNFWIRQEESNGSRKNMVIKLIRKVDSDLPFSYPHPWSTPFGLPSGHAAKGPSIGLSSLSVLPIELGIH